MPAPHADNENRTTTSSSDDRASWSLMWFARWWNAVCFTYRRARVWLFGYDYFISYTHESASYARDLHARLSKHACFLDAAAEGVLAGEELDEVIYPALRRSRILVLVWSPAVANKDWPRAESRFFASSRGERRFPLNWLTHSPRSFIPIFPDPYPAAAPDVIFGSKLNELQPRLDAACEKYGRQLRAGNTPVPQNLGIVENAVADLRAAVPSEETLKELRKSHEGMSVPGKVRIALTVTALVIAVLGLFGWNYYASSRADALFAELRAIVDAAGEHDCSAPEYRSLSVELDGRTIASNASDGQRTIEETWRQICVLLKNYDWYRRWTIPSFDYRGIQVQLHWVSDVVTAPQDTYPDGVVDLRIEAQTLSADWIRFLGLAPRIETLEVVVPEVEDMQGLRTLIQNQGIADVRFQRCRGLTLDWLNQLLQGNSRSVRELRFASLADLEIRSSAHEKAFLESLTSCRGLTVLEMGDSRKVRFSDDFLPDLLKRHKRLCAEGRIQMNSELLASGAVPPSVDELVCQCDVTVIEVQEFTQRFSDSPVADVEAFDIGPGAGVQEDFEPVPFSGETP